MNWTELNLHLYVTTGETLALSIRILVGKVMSLLQITADSDCSHEIKRRLLLGRKSMTNLDIILLTKVYIVKAMVFPVIMYGCESWTINKAVYVCLVPQFCPNPCNPMDCSLLGSFVHGDSPGKNTGVGCHALLQGIFPTQEWNQGLLHCRQFFTSWATREA